MACRPAAIEWALPADLLLEITAHSDIRTLVRCTTLCKLLRRDILDPFFIRRLTKHGIVPPCILVYFRVPDTMEASPPLLSLVHPATPDAALFCNHHLSPFMCRDAHDILRDYYPVTSRGGLILLRRHHLVSRNIPDMCVYDLITGHRTFLPEPSGIPYDSLGFLRFVLLTAADGIGCPFFIFVGSLDTSSRANNNTPPAIRFQTFTSSTNTWGSVVTHEEVITKFSLELLFDTIILHDGVIYWLTHRGAKILTYDVRTAEPGTLELPVHDPATPNIEGGELHLSSYSSPDGRKLLRLFVLVGFTISVWHHLPHGRWALETMIDIKEKLRSLVPGAPFDQPPKIWFKFSSERSNAVLMHMHTTHLTIFLDLETEEMHMTSSTPSSMLLEIDMPSRLQGLKTFS